MKAAKILYFVDGFNPTPEDFAAAEKLSANVVFRNARVVPAEGSLEEADGVAGVVPQRYKDAYPEAKEAIKAHKSKRDEATAKAGDVPPVIQTNENVLKANQGKDGDSKPVGDGGTPDPLADANSKPTPATSQKPDTATRTAPATAGDWGSQQNPAK